MWRSNLTNGLSKSCGKGKCHAHYRNGSAALLQLLRTYKQNAQLRGLTFSLSERQFHVLTQQDCYYCGAPPSNTLTVNDIDVPWRYNGIDRKENSAGYVITNCVPCCGTCNFAKATRNHDEFVTWACRVAAHSRNYGPCNEQHLRSAHG